MYTDCTKTHKIKKHKKGMIKYDYSLKTSPFLYILHVINIGVSPLINIIIACYMTNI